MHTMQECTYTLGFSALPGIGTKRFEKLVSVFGSAKLAWEAENSDIIAVLGDKLGKKFIDFRNSFHVQQYTESLQQRSIAFLIPSDKQYPILLKKLQHPPFILFAKGNIELLQEKRTIGVVGTRKATSYGKQVTEMFVRGLVLQGFIIVSGMALGIDSIAHEEAIKNNGATIAVLGSGVDVPTPREHAKLYQKILENNGLIVSTFSPGQDAGKGSFPARNAIIAGLSQGVLVVEGAKNSGSLITAAYARQFNRPVFAVPGQITSYLSEGTNTLIKQGAIATGSIHDIIDTLGSGPEHYHEDATRPKGKTKEEKQILKCLENGPLLFDEIVRKIGKDSKYIGSLLSFMELQGLVHSSPEGKYSI